MRGHELAVADSRLDAPEADGAVAARAGEQPVLGMERERLDRFAVAEQLLFELVCVEVENADGEVDGGDVMARGAPLVFRRGIYRAWSALPATRGETVELPV